MTGAHPVTVAPLVTLDDTFAGKQRNSCLWNDVDCPSDVNILINLCIHLLELALQSSHTFYM